MSGPAAAPAGATTLDDAYGDPGSGRGPVVPGHVSVAARVLTRVAAAVVAEELRVDRSEVRVDASDDAGHLALRVSTPVRIPALSESMPVPEGGVVGTEAVLAALARPALLVSPLDVLPALETALDGEAGLVLAAGVASAVVGVVLLALGLTAGHRGRHELADERVAAVVDDTVVAASLARTARVAGRLGESQVTVWVSRRQARVDLTPASGVTVDEQAVLGAVRRELDEAAWRPAVSATTRVADHGRLDA